MYKIAGLIRKRRFNIESLTVSHTIVPGISRFTILVDGDDDVVEKMSRQLFRIIEVLDVLQPAEGNVIASEVALVKVSLEKPGSRDAVMKVVRDGSARLLEETPLYLAVEVTGTEEKIDGFYTHMQQFGVIDFVRTGRAAMLV